MIPLLLSFLCPLDVQCAVTWRPTTEGAEVCAYHLKPSDDPFAKHEVTPRCVVLQQDGQRVVMERIGDE